MTLNHVETTSQPMIQYTARASMDPKEIERVMTAAFQALGRFTSENRVTPLGPPIAVYSDWSQGDMKVEVGYPVSAADAAKANGEIAAGSTPGGHAIMTIHRGPYDSLRETYAAIESEMSKAGLPQSGLAWEVYVGEPGVTADADLVTEIYMQVAPEDVSRLPAA